VRQRLLFHCADAVVLPQICVPLLLVVNADTNMDIRDIPAGMFAATRLLFVPNRTNFALRANTNPSTVESVAFYSGDLLINLDDLFPFALGGDVNGDYNGYGPLSAGQASLTIRAVPYFNGTEGQATQLDIAVQEEQVTGITPEEYSQLYPNTVTSSPTSAPVSPVDTCRLQRQTCNRNEDCCVPGQLLCKSDSCQAAPAEVYGNGCLGTGRDCSPYRDQCCSPGFCGEESNSCQAPAAFCYHYPINQLPNGCENMRIDGREEVGGGNTCKGFGEECLIDANCCGDLACACGACK